MNKLVELKKEVDFALSKSNELKAWRDDIKLLEEIVKKYKDEVKKRCEEGDIECGWQLEIQNAGLEFDDLNAVFKASGLSQEDFIQCCKVSMMELRRKYINKTVSESYLTEGKRITKEQATQELDAKLGKIGTMKTKKVLKEIKEII